MKKVLYFINALENGGAENGLATLVKHGFFPPNVDLRITALSRGDSDLADSLTKVASLTVYTKCNRLTFTAFAIAFVRMPLTMLKVRPDIVILSLAQANILGRFWSIFFPSVHLVAFEHLAATSSPSIKHSLYNSLNRLLSFRVDSLWADSDATLVSVRQNYPSNIACHSVPLFVAPNPLPPSRLLDASEPFTIITACRLVPRKRVIDIVSVIPELRSKGIDARMVIYGDGPDRKNLSDAAQRLGISDRVTIAGHVRNWHAVAAGHVFVTFSNNEGLCISNLEAMSIGLPLVTTPVGAIEEYAFDGTTACIVTTRDSLRFALIVAAKNPALAHQNALMARSFIQRKYSAASLRALGLSIFSDSSHAQ